MGTAVGGGVQTSQQSSPVGQTTSPATVPSGGVAQQGKLPVGGAVGWTVGTPVGTGAGSGARKLKSFRAGSVGYSVGSEDVGF